MGFTIRKDFNVELRMEWTEKVGLGFEMPEAVQTQEKGGK